jgi:hypothetical protein
MKCFALKVLSVDYFRQVTARDGRHRSIYSELEFPRTYLVLKFINYMMTYTIDVCNPLAYKPLLMFLLQLAQQNEDHLRVINVPEKIQCQFL